MAFHGDYAGALALVGEGEDAKSLAVRAECLAAKGDVQSALGLIKDKRDEQLLAGKILLAAYRPAEARGVLMEYVRGHPQSAEGHYLLGRAFEQLGDMNAARGGYAWFGDQKFLEQWQANPDAAVFGSAAEVVAIGEGLNRYAILSGMFAREAGLHQQILDLFTRSYDVIDREYWPAHRAAAEYFWAHDQEKEATEELAGALAGNPRDEESLGLSAKISLEDFDFDSADRAIADIRQVNPGSITADLLEGRSLLQQRRAADAEVVLGRVVKKMPANIEAMGLLASAAALRLEEGTEKQILAEIEKIAPQDATAYEELGDQLGGMRQYPRAEAMYKMAIARAPWWAQPRNALGLLYTQSGDEAQARVALTAARALDPFNLRTANYLQLLDNLDHFARKESAHFVISYDAKTDAILADYFSEYLESIYPVICGTFHHELAVKTYIEIFPTHAEFSVRTTGTPWIGTVGASTGRVVALVSPREGENTLGTFNWAEVLRHEFTHTVTLSATDNRISHWMTEGLATLEEGTPMRWEWVPMVYLAVTKDQLFPIGQLTFSFIRPKRSADRQLAYAESYWICQYIRDHQGWGWPAILKMMDGYREGKTEPEVFRGALGMSDTEFFKQFTAWARRQVAGWGYDPASDAKYDAMRAEAEGLVADKNYEDAIELWKKIAELRPMDELPHKRLAGLYLALKDNAGAISELRVLDTLSLKDNAYAKAIARLYGGMGDWKNAAGFALRAVYINPYDRGAHELLMEAESRVGNAVLVQREKMVLTKLSGNAN